MSLGPYPGHEDIALSRKQMKKKILSLALTLAMCLGLTVPALAAEENYFSKNGLPVQQEPPSGAVPFTFIMYESNVPEEVAKSMTEQGKFYMESCTSVPAAQAGYQTITLKVRLELSFVTDLETGTALLRAGFNGGIYDYYTGEQLKIGNMYGDDTASNIHEITYGGKTYKLEYAVDTQWEQGVWSNDRINNRSICPFTCYQTVTVTAPTDYDGLVYYLGNRDNVISPEVDFNTISYAEAEKTAMYFRFGPKAPTQPTTPVEPEKPAGVKTANPTNDKLEVNGAAADPTVYKIGGSNYFKIRDVAAVLNGTEKQFAVGYSGGKVTVTSGQSYEATGKELAGAPDSAGEASPSNDAIVIDGVETGLTVYKIGGSNYFKLRDLGEALNFYVGWEAGRGVFIETDRPYSK
jgi:hypothetical protein